MTESVTIPRILVAATASGVGKTTATVALVAAMRERGLRVAVFKCGPDYLDPTYHERVAGVRSHNLDGWMMGRDAVRATFARASHGFDLAVIEGMMGLFDSSSPISDEGSSAEIAKWLRAPVVLVVDASGMARSVAATSLGYASFDPGIKLAGLICNRVGGRRHLELLRQASTHTPVLGGLPVRADLAFPERHLGLHVADADSLPDSSIRDWAALAAQWLDLDAILSIAHCAPAIPQLEIPAPDTAAAARCRIGVALDDAFHFYYEDNLARLRSLGAELVNFAPSRDARLPKVDGLYLGGGYPEALAQRLSENRSMLEAVRAFAGSGRPIYAECGGLMYLSEAIRTLDGATWPMVGVLPGIAVMREHLQALGYVEVETRADSILGPAGTRFRGHQFRHSTLEDTGRSGESERIYSVRPRWGQEEFSEGYRAGAVIGSYVHAHWASNPRCAAEFVAACARAREAQGEGQAQRVKRAP
jgi:cobyrinic acid a,c-diamide synthase